VRFFELNSSLVKRHRAWSDDRFGTRAERGPQGSLKHLAKEVEEALAAPHDIEEYADIMFLVLDSVHRAGYHCADLERAMFAKMPVLEMRTYPKPVPDMPVEHIRTGD
jgi:hypothetical protein